MRPAELVSQYSKKVAGKGWVANHDGNLSLKNSDEKHFFVTPTAMAKEDIDSHHILMVDLSGKVVSGRRRIFSEWALHKACYEARPDIKAVIHSHSPYATAFGVARRALPAPALPEMVVSLGVNIPLLDYAMPKDAGQLRALQNALTDGDAEALLLSGNGLITVGADLEQAFLRMELVEHYAQIVSHALPLGGVAPLPHADIAELLAARTKAGLGRTARIQ